ncbi:hypothetical protein PVK06_031640 [Gossypium arboreum]|uniref:Uncharacterized protein n=1 Tax=Gossypium arboreum TaxID=29729 RepID=A0ABR0NU74_GOSAR|nr:hypothetical protein PVK06_031640 [Gossypium arboreum]
MRLMEERSGDARWKALFGGSSVIEIDVERHREEGKRKENRGGAWVRVRRMWRGVVWCEAGYGVRGLRPAMGGVTVATTWLGVEFRFCFEEDGEDREDELGNWVK